MHALKIEQVTCTREGSTPVMTEDPDSRLIAIVIKVGVGVGFHEALAGYFLYVFMHFAYI